MLIRAMTIEDYEQCMKLRARIPELGVHPDFDTRERIHMAVSREHRGLGLARGRIERSMTELRRGGIVDAFLFTHYGNPAAAAFWEHNGWRVIPGISYHYREL